jgi:thiosulfate reductase cytochrome b subunit
VSGAVVKKGRRVRVHSLIVRLTHWINAYAMCCMIASGWGIYNASPLFAFRFPAWATLGGWLGGSIAWHLAAMWLLVANGLLYLLHGLVSRHFRRDFLPIAPREIGRDLGRALRFRLHHELGRYNAVQRLSYVGVLALGALAVLSGLALWKPVQFDVIAGAVGGYEVVRRIHFVAMAGIVLFILVHLALVLIVPRTLPSMVTGRIRVPETAP